MLLAHHILGEALGGQQRTEEIEVEYELNALRVEVKEGLDPLRFLGKVAEFKGILGGGAERRIAARAVDEYIAGAEGRINLLPCVLKALGLKDIAADSESRAAVGVYLVDDLLRRILTQVEHCDLNAE